MKIIFPRMETTVFHNAYDGGCKFIQQLGETLVKKGCEVEVVTTKLRNNPSLQEANHKGVKYKFILPKYTGKRIIPFNMFYKLIFSYNLNKYLKKEKFDILHNSEAFAYFYLHNKHRKKVIFQSWALEPFYGYESSSQKGIKKLYVKWALQKPWKYCIQNSEIVTADNESQIEMITRLGVDKKDIRFIPIGIPFKKIQEFKKTFKNKREVLGFNRKDLVILSVGQLTDEKGIIEIIEGFEIVKKQIKNAKLIIIGKGPLEEKIKNIIQIKKLSQDVTHLKDVPEEDLFNYHFSSDIFVSGTHTNYPTISVQEALATGLPIVSGADLFLIEDGVNGFCVGLKNPKGIAEGILKICQSKGMKKMGKNSIKKVENSDYENVSELAIQAYKELLKEQN